MGRVAGKVALVTGAANGIGRAAVLALSGEGAAVAIADIDFAGASRLAEEIGPTATAHYFDARSPASLSALVDGVVERHGHLDVICNNVASTGADAWRNDRTVLDTSLRVWDQTFTVNVRSIFLLCKFSLPYLLEGGSSSIVNMASSAGLRGGPSRTAYGASKAALIGLTRQLAAQYGREGVRSNAIAPGIIRTRQLMRTNPTAAEMALERISSPRVGEEADVAHAVVFLASDESGFINGETIRVDGGGMTTRPKPRRAERESDNPRAAR